MTRLSREFNRHWPSAGVGAAHWPLKRPALVKMPGWSRCASTPAKQRTDKYLRRKVGENVSPTGLSRTSLQRLHHFLVSLEFAELPVFFRREGFGTLVRKRGAAAVRPRGRQPVAGTFATTN